MEQAKALPPTTLFPSVNGPGQLWTGGGGFAPTTLFPLVNGRGQLWIAGGGYYTFPFGQWA